MKIRFANASQKDRIEDTALGRSSYFSDNYIRDIDFYWRNKLSLSIVYNIALKKARADQVDALVLLHDDVIINCHDIRERIEKYLKIYDVFGVAGNSAPTIRSPVLWHLMSERDKLRGCVAHGNDSWYDYTSFGPLPAPVILIDGVFIAINLNKVPESVQFDEANPAKFHFYDLNFSMDCSLNKVRVGVGDVPIIHSSPGLANISAEWRAGEDYFLKKYEKYLNKTLTV